MQAFDFILKLFSESVDMIHSFYYVALEKFNVFLVH